MFDVRGFETRGPAGRRALDVARQIEAEAPDPTGRVAAALAAAEETTDGPPDALEAALLEVGACLCRAAAEVAPRVAPAERPRYVRNVAGALSLVAAGVDKAREWTAHLERKAAKARQRGGRAQKRRAARAGQP
ncbi:MAG TPA: hypothetical protein VFS43_00195 [Polyangiaceae bacterium]|nr:hypothetical protein [Polyangiaceae bacterium]